MPIVTGLSGFQGYLWFPPEGGFTAINLFNPEASALESNAAAGDWAAEYLTDFTDGTLQVINVTGVLIDLPVLID